MMAPVSGRDGAMTDISLQKTAKTASRGRRAAVSKGAVRQSCGAAARLLEPGDPGGRAVARWRSHGVDPQGGRAGACRRSGGLAALSRPHRRAAPRTGGRARFAADPRRRRYPGRDKSGHRRSRARRHHPERGVHAVPDDRNLSAGDRCERFRRPLAGIGGKSGGEPRRYGGSSSQLGGAV